MIPNVLNQTITTFLVISQLKALFFIFCAIILFSCLLNLSFEPFLCSDLKINESLKTIIKTTNDFFFAFKRESTFPETNVFFSTHFHFNYNYTEFVLIFIKRGLVSHKILFNSKFMRKIYSNLSNQQGNPNIELA